MAEIPTFSSADTLLLDPSNNMRLSLGCPILDKYLTGGIPIHGITEICGESASGKSQFCMQIILQTLLPTDLGGLGGGAFFLSTEGEFPMKRLEQMIPYFLAKYNLDWSLEELLANIYIEKVEHIEEQWNVMVNRLPLLLRERNVKVVIVDSIASIIRTDFDHNREGMVHRSRLLLKLAAHAKRCSDEFHVPFIMVNQVSAAFGDSPLTLQLPGNTQLYHSTMNSNNNSSNTSSNDRDETEGGGDGGPGSSSSHTTGAGGGSWSMGCQQQQRFVPALGLAWSNCVNTRVSLCRWYGGGGGRVEFVGDENAQLTNGGNNGGTSRGGGGTGVRRWMAVEFSPCGPPQGCEFEVVAGGVVGVGPQGGPLTTDFP